MGDGPRAKRVGETEKVAATRAIIERVDWDCEVLTNFSDENLGCRRRVSSGIDWIFEQADEAIVLEDDCVPSSSFYRFCVELLAFYEGNPGVMHVSGSNFQYGRRRGRASYYFSRYAHCWGWATWGRAWQRFSFQQGAPDAPPTGLGKTLGAEY